MPRLCFCDFEDKQTTCVKAIYKGKVWLLTGFGKSMCHEVLPFVLDDKLGRRDRITSYWKLDKDDTRKNPCRTPIVYYNQCVRSATLST